MPFVILTNPWLSNGLFGPRSRFVLVLVGASEQEKRRGPAEKAAWDRRSRLGHDTETVVN